MCYCNKVQETWRILPGTGLSCNCCPKLPGMPGCVGFHEPTIIIATIKAAPVPHLSKPQPTPGFCLRAGAPGALAPAAISAEVTSWGHSATVGSCRWSSTMYCSCTGTLSQSTSSWLSCTCRQHRGQRGLHTARMRFGRLPKMTSFQRDSCTRRALAALRSGNAIWIHPDLNVL